MTDRAQAYVYSGDWVSDCPRPDCSNVEHLFMPLRPGGPRVEPRRFFACSYCGYQTEITWPDRSFMADAMVVLMKRPVPATRNWYPVDHATAVKFKVPHGQSVDDLRAENEEHGVAV